MPLASVGKYSVEAQGQFACPTCDAPIGQPCVSVAVNPQDACGRYRPEGFALELPHRKRMALRKAAKALEVAGLGLADLQRFSATFVGTGTLGS